MKKNKLYTHIDFFRVDEEVYADIMFGQSKIGSFNLIGDWKDPQDILDSLADEAGRLGYKKSENIEKEEEIYTRQEVLEMIRNAYYAGLSAGSSGDDYVSDNFLAEDYLKK